MKYWTDCITLTSGCTKASPACLHCWAETNHNFRLKRIEKYNHPFNEVHVHPENITKIDHTKKPRTFQVWNDAFHPEVKDGVLDLLFEAINRNCQHTYLICTKRLERMAEYFNREENYKFLAETHNIYLGTTVEHPDYLWRVEELLKCRPFKLFLSIEPMLSEIRLDKCHYSYCNDRDKNGLCKMPVSCDYKYLGHISYIISGCESGPNARETKEEWVKDLRDQCLAAGVPLWVKQLRVNGKMVYNHSLSTINPEDLWKGRGF